MNLLAIDTATERFSAALGEFTPLFPRKDAEAQRNGEENKKKIERTWLFEADAGMRHSELIMGCIDMLMNKAALTPQDLSGVLCMGGPGSFTGLRIGFSIAKGIALPLGIPFAAIPTLDCIAWPFSAWPGLVVPVIDAKKSSFFCALYRSGKRLCADMDASPADIARTIIDTGLRDQVLLTGPGAALLYEKWDATNLSITLGKNLRWGNAASLPEIARETNIFAKNTDNHYADGPVYIRKSDAELNE